MKAKYEKPMLIIEKFAGALNIIEEIDFVE